MTRERARRHFASLAVLAMFAFLAFGSEDTNRSGGETSNIPAIPAPASGSPERLTWEIEKALVSYGPDENKVSSIAVEQTTIRVRFKISSNLTESFVKSGARADIVSVLNGVDSSGYKYSEVTIVGTHSMRDRFGNAKEQDVVRVTYMRSTVDKINWDGFKADDVYIIADEAWVHPAFQ